MTYGRYPNLKKIRSHGSVHRPVSMASTGIIGSRTFNYHPGQPSQLLSEPSSTSWLHKLHLSAPWPRLQGTTSSSRTRRFSATTVGCVIYHTYDEIYEKIHVNQRHTARVRAPFVQNWIFANCAKVFFFVKCWQKPPETPLCDRKKPNTKVLFILLPLNLKNRRFMMSFYLWAAKNKNGAKMPVFACFLTKKRGFRRNSISRARGNLEHF